MTRGKAGIPEIREAGNNILKTRTQNNVCLSIYLPINPHQTSKNGYEGKRLKNKNKMKKIEVKRIWKKRIGSIREKELTENGRKHRKVRKENQREKGN